MTRAWSGQPPPFGPRLPAGMAAAVAKVDATVVRLADRHNRHTVDRPPLPLLECVAGTRRELVLLGDEAGRWTLDPLVGAALAHLADAAGALSAGYAAALAAAQDAAPREAAPCPA